MEKGEVKWKPSSLSPWFLFLLCLNILDILVTNPSFEANPFTLYMWGKLGIVLSAWIKIGQVLVFGFVCVLAKKITKPMDWRLIKKLLLGTLVVLVTFYVVVVVWNTLLYFSLPLG